jgi:hypothetical protein
MDTTLSKQLEQSTTEWHVLRQSFFRMHW